MPLQRKTLILCHTFRNLNLIEETQFFTTLDFFSGYWQVQMVDASKEYTTFTTYEGLYQSNVLPFGLCNVPSTFQRVMECVLRGLNWQICLIYTDDIITFSKTFEEHLQHLHLVFSCLRQANIKLKPSKCHFAYPKVTYLGHIVSRLGIQSYPDKISAVQNFPVPKKLKDLRSFLGLAKYYRPYYRQRVFKNCPSTNKATLEKRKNYLVSGVSKCIYTS